VADTPYPRKTRYLPSINCWEDRRVVEAVTKTGRKKLVMAALWTEMCLAMPAIHAMGDGYDVYVVTDASGGRMERPMLTAYLSTRCDIPQEAADAVMRELAELAVKETNAHKVFTIPGIGVIVKSFREARMGRDPYTGKAEFLPARKAVKARLDRDLGIMCGDGVARADQQT
jgi:nucleoid DNA-binding protein